MSRQPKSPSSYHPYFVFPGNSRSHSSSGACPSTAVLAPSSMAPQPFSNWNGRSGFGKAPTLKGRRLPPPPTQNSMYHESRYKTVSCNLVFFLATAYHRVSRSYVASLKKLDTASTETDVSLLMEFKS